MRLSIVIALAAMMAFCLPLGSMAASSSSTAKAVSHPIILLQTTKGQILIKLFPEDAPITCANFVKLVKEHFYDGTAFHRVQDLVAPGVAHIVQGGSPLSKTMPVTDPRVGMGGSGATIKGEFPSNGVNNSLTHVPGAVAMARSNDPNSASCQFYICTTAAHELDGNYCVFGIVIKGLDKASYIVVGDKIVKATVVKD
jgi:peptidyl-prolyl cis-trans isomerase B (cyclophilin B)